MLKDKPGYEINTKKMEHGKIYPFEYDGSKLGVMFDGKAINIYEFVPDEP